MSLCTPENSAIQKLPIIMMMMMITISIPTAMVEIKEQTTRSAISVYVTIHTCILLVTPTSVYVYKIYKFY